MNLASYTVLYPGFEQSIAMMALVSFSVVRYRKGSNKSDRKTRIRKENR